MLRSVVSCIFFFWEFIQNFFGFLYFIYLLFFEDVVTLDTGRQIEVYTKSYRGSVSLGIFTFYNTWYLGNESVKSVNTHLHESKGHRIQSIILGPLYIPVIGIPSILWATFCTVFKKSKISYYKFYTEKWADTLAGIKR